MVDDPHVGPYVDTDLSFAWLIAPDERTFVNPSGAVDAYHEHLLQPRVRGLFGWHFADHFGVFGGAGVLTQVRMLRDGNEALIRIGPEFVAGVEL